MAKKKTGLIIGVTLGGLAIVGTGVAVALSRGKSDDATRPKGDEPQDEPTPQDEPPAHLPKPYANYKRGPYTIDLTKLGNGIRWRVWETPAPGVAPIIEPTNEEELGHGLEVSDEDARIAANAFVDNLVPIEGGGLPPPPPPPPPLVFEAQVVDEPDNGGQWLPTSEGTTASIGGQLGPGVLLSSGGTRLYPTHGLSWIAWAAPRILANKDMDPLELTILLLSEAFPEEEWDAERVDEMMVGDYAMVDLIADADSKYLVDMRGFDTWANVAGESTLSEKAAARLMAVKPPKHKIPGFVYRGHVIGLDKKDGEWVWDAKYGPTHGDGKKFGDTAPKKAEAIEQMMIAVNAHLESME